MRQNKYIPVCVGGPPRTGPTLFTHLFFFFFFFHMHPNALGRPNERQKEEEEGQGDEEEMKANGIATEKK